MLDDIKLGWNRMNMEPLIMFPLAILVVGVLPTILELVGIRPIWSSIGGSVLAAGITVIEMLRVRGRMEKTATHQGRKWAD